MIHKVLSLFLFFVLSLVLLGVVNQVEASAIQPQRTVVGDDEHYHYDEQDDQYLDERYEQDLYLNRRRHGKDREEDNWGSGINRPYIKEKKRNNSRAGYDDDEQYSTSNRANDKINPAGQSSQRREDLYRLREEVDPIEKDEQDKPEKDPIDIGTPPPPPDVPDVSVSQHSLWLFMVMLSLAVFKWVFSKK